MDRPPIGVEIEWRVDSLETWFTGIVRYVGNAFVLLEDDDGKEIPLHLNEFTWRYIETEQDKMRNYILELWRQRGIDYAYDQWSSVPGDFILEQMMKR